MKINCLQPNFTIKSSKHKIQKVCCKLLSKGLDVQYALGLILYILISLLYCRLLMWIFKYSVFSLCFSLVTFFHIIILKTDNCKFCHCYYKINNCLYLIMKSKHLRQLKNEKTWPATGLLTTRMVVSGFVVDEQTAITNYSDIKGGSTFHLVNPTITTNSVIPPINFTYQFLIYFCIALRPLWNL